MSERAYSIAKSYRYGFNGKETDPESSIQDYGMRIYNPALGKFLSIDPLSKKYSDITTYQFASNCPISGFDLDGLEYYYAADGTYLGQGSNPESTEVRLGKITGKTKTGKNIISAVDLDGKAQKTWTVIHANHDEFKRLAGVLYAEGSTSWKEAAAIYSVLENRAKLEDNTVTEQAQTKKGVYGASEADKINSKVANKSNVKNAYKGLINGILSKEDFSGGAFFWDGKDFNGKNKKKGGYNQRYLPGFDFTDEKHDLWKQADNVKSGKANNVSWDYKYESTAAEGNTTFSKLTDSWRDGQLPDKKDKKGNITEKRKSNELGK